MQEEANNRKPTTEGHVSLALRGIALACISGLSTSGAVVIAKYLSNIHPGQLAAYRFWCIATLTLPQIIWKKENVLGPPAHRVSILVIALSNATGVCLAFFASRYLPLGEVVVLCGSYPVFVTFVGKIVLKETFGILHLTAVCVCLAGLILTTGLHETVTKNSFTAENIYGIAAALGAAVAFVVLFTLGRKRREIHFSVLVFNGGIVGIIEAVVLTTIVGNFTFQHSSLERGLIILLGFLSHSGFMSAVASLRYAEAGPVTIVKTSSEVLSSFVYQLVIFDDVPEPSTICGAALVCVSITFIGLEQKFRTLIPYKCSNLF